MHAGLAMCCVNGLRVHCAGDIEAQQVDFACLRSRHIAGVQRIQVVCSMNPATTVGRHPLAPRLAALLHVARMSYPPPAQLQTILSTLLTGTLDKAGLDCWDACRRQKHASLRHHKRGHHVA